MGQDQVLLRPGHTDIEQTPLFRFIDFHARAAEGNQPLLATHNEYHRKFQPLGGVQGHQCHPVGPGIILIDRGLQGDIL